MAEVITRFKLETTQYDSKLRDASKSLSEFARNAASAGEDFSKLSKERIEAAQAFGRIGTNAMTSKGKVQELVGAFNDVAKVYNKLTAEQQQSDFGKALAESMTQLSVRIKEAKQDLYSLGDAAKSGGLFSGLGDKMSGALQVFGGNLMTKAAGAVANLGSEMYGMVQQGIELAKQGEGIRIAFERLGRGDILDGLRRATHGTVTDLELMKAAVKFNDFKLPVEELGTMLAFAQQKAKDTGQSIDYMVDSIVTGLGRKSLMILDNLGLSAAEIKEKMAETGDMTKAVGEIIREQMAKAGDYVETAADRAAQANVNLQNKMEELGRKFAPLQEASNNLWTSMKIGIMDLIGGPLTNFINKLTEAGRIAQQYGVLGGNSKVGRLTTNLINAREGNRQSIYQQQQEQFWRYINPREQQIRDIRAWQRGERGEALQGRINAITEKYGSLDATKIQAEVDAAKKMLSDYQKAAKTILAPVEANISTNDAINNVESLKVKLAELEAQRKKAIAAGDTELSKNLLKQINQTKADIRGLDPNALKTKGGSKNSTYAPDSIAAQQALVQQLTKQWNEAGADVRDQYLQPLIEAEQKVKYMQNAMNLQKEQAQGKLLGGEIQTTGLGTITGGLPDISKGIDQEKLPKILSPLQQLNDELERLKELLELAPNTEAYQAGLQAIADKEKEIAQFKGTSNLGKDADKSAKSFQSAASAISQVGSALNSIEDPTAKIMGIVAQAIAGVAAGAGQAVSAKDTTSSGWAWIGAAAAITASMIAMISQIHSATGYQNGGVVKGYANGGIASGIGGGMIEGTTYSSDQIPIMANAGEVILNRAQSSNIASQLQKNGGGAIRVVGVLKGEDIVLMADRYGLRTGRGELAFWNN